MLLKNVLHVPQARLNLISGGVLDDEGYVFSLANSSWELTKDSIVVMKGLKCCGLYKAQATVSNQEVGSMCGMTRHMDSVKGRASAFTPVSSKGTVVDNFASDVDSPIAKEFSPSDNVVGCVSYDLRGFWKDDGRKCHSLSGFIHSGECFGAYVSSSSLLKRNVPRRMRARIMERRSKVDGDASHFSLHGLSSSL